MAANSAVQSRKEAIVDMLVRPMTLKQIAAQLGVSYYTARNDIADLKQQNLVRDAHTIIDGAHTFVSGGKRPMPMFALGTGQVSMMTIVKYYGEVTTEPAKAYIDYVYRANFLLANIARNPNPSLINNKDLAEIRSSLAKARSGIEQAMKIADQLLMDARLWRADLLPTITGDEEWDDELIEKVRVATS